MKNYLTSFVCPECGGRLITTNTGFEGNICILKCADCERNLELDKVQETSLTDSKEPLWAIVIPDYRIDTKDLKEKFEKVEVYNRDRLISVAGWDNRPSAATLYSAVTAMSDTGIPEWSLELHGNHIRDTAYGKYQLDWMMKHGHTIGQMLDIMQDIWEDTGEYICPKEAFNSFLTDAGFGTELFICKDEFLENEYRNNAYMSELLTEQEFSIYLNDIQKKTEIPPVVRIVTCADCLHYEECKNGFGICGHYGESVSGNENADDCNHYRNYDGNSYSLIYNGDIIVDNIMSTDCSTSTDDILPEEAVRCFGDKFIVKELMSLPEYNPSLWSIERN